MIFNDRKHHINAQKHMVEHKPNANKLDLIHTHSHTHAHTNMYRRTHTHTNTQ